MKNFSHIYKYAKGFGVFMFAVLFVACTQLDIEPNQLGDDLRVLALSASCTGPTVDPRDDLSGPGGNVECSQAGVYGFSSGRLNYENGVFGVDEGDPKAFVPKDWPDGFTIHTDGIFVSWEFESYTDPTTGKKMCLKDLSVIVKGGDAANVYTYTGGETSDCKLVSPNNASGGPAGLSNLTLCYNLEPCDDDKCYEFNDETAWSAGSRYNTRGNWATYTAYSAGSTVKLFAGQTLEAGSVSFSAPVDGEVEITITLNKDWFFDDVLENVKIQDYATAPSGNPSPGGFAYKGEGTGSTFSITVPANNFYGVHVDVTKRTEVECVIEEVEE